MASLSVATICVNLELTEVSSEMTNSYKSDESTGVWSLTSRTVTETNALLYTKYTTDFTQRLHTKIAVSVPGSLWLSGVTSLHSESIRPDRFIIQADVSGDLS